MIHSTAFEVGIEAARQLAALDQISATVEGATKRAEEARSNSVGWNNRKTQSSGSTLQCL
ncbi:hypothetical protein ACXHXG_14675 [Rhizobium sp. LEGMi198b]